MAMCSFEELLDFHHTLNNEERKIRVEIFKIMGDIFLFAKHFSKGLFVVKCYSQEVSKSLF